MKLKLKRKHLKIIANYMSAVISMDELVQEFYKAGSFDMTSSVIKNEDVDNEILKRIIEEKKNGKLTGLARDVFVQKIYKDHFFDTLYGSAYMEHITEPDRIEMVNVTYDEDVTSPIPRNIRLTEKDYRDVYRLNVDVDISNVQFVERAIEFGTSAYDGDNAMYLSIAIASSITQLYMRYFENYLSVDEFISFSLIHSNCVLEVYYDMYTTRTAETAFEVSIDNIMDIVTIMHKSIRDGEDYVEAIKEYLGSYVSYDVIESLYELPSDKEFVSDDL